MVSTLKENKLCMNCLRPGHFIKQCKSLHRCRKCQKPQHTLLHVEPEQGSRATSMPSVPAPTNLVTKSVTSHAAAGLTSNALLMTCRVLVDAPDGSAVEARAILDSASSRNVWHKLSVSLVRIKLPRSRELLACLTVPHFDPSQVSRCPPCCLLTRRWRSQHHA